MHAERAAAATAARFCFARECCGGRQHRSNVTQSEHYRATGGKRRGGEERRGGGGGGRIEKRERQRREALARGVAKNGEDVSRGGGLDSVKQWTVYAEVQQTGYAQYQLRPAGPQRRARLRYGGAQTRCAVCWSRTPFSHLVIVRFARPFRRRGATATRLIDHATDRPTRTT